MPKRGDVHPVTGLVYWDTFNGRERWRSAEVISAWRIRSKIHVDRWQKADPVRHRASQKRFRDVHGKRRNAESRAYRNRWKKIRRALDSAYRLQVSVAARMRTALNRKDLRKQNRTMKVLGCTAAFLKRYLESQFRPEMSWDNYGIRGWHVDHRTPLASAQTVEDVERLCHYSNLQPLWWHENLSKGSKILAA